MQVSAECPMCGHRNLAELKSLPETINCSGCLRTYLAMVKVEVLTAELSQDQREAFFDE